MPFPANWLLGQEWFQQWKGEMAERYPLYGYIGGLVREGKPLLDWRTLTGERDMVNRPGFRWETQRGGEPPLPNWWREEQAQDWWRRWPPAIIPPATRPAQSFIGMDIPYAGGRYGPSAYPGGGAYPGQMPVAGPDWRGGRAEALGYGPARPALGAGGMTPGEGLRYAPSQELGPAQRWLVNARDPWREMMPYGGMEGQYRRPATLTPVEAALVKIGETAATGGGVTTGAEPQAQGWPVPWAAIEGMPSWRRDWEEWSWSTRGIPLQGYEIWRLSRNAPPWGLGPKGEGGGRTPVEGPQVPEQESWRPGAGSWTF